MNILKWKCNLNSCSSAKRLPLVLSTLLSPCSNPTSQYLDGKVDKRRSTSQNQRIYPFTPHPPALSGRVWGQPLNTGLIEIIENFGPGGGRAISALPLILPSAPMWRTVLQSSGSMVLLVGNTVWGGREAFICHAFDALNIEEQQTFESGSECCSIQHSTMGPVGMKGCLKLGDGRLYFDTNTYTLIAWKKLHSNIHI